MNQKYEFQVQILKLIHSGMNIFQITALLRMSIKLTCTGS